MCYVWGGRSTGSHHLENALSKPLTALPTFLSAVSMVGDDQERTIRELVHAERPSPPIYDPARDLFIGVLRGHFTIEEALVQARRLHDGTERRCAEDVLAASKSFLTKELPAGVARLKPMEILLPNGLELGVSPVWLRYRSPDRLMVLHFWRQPLSDWQRSAAAAILITALKKDNPAYMWLDLDFISVAIPDHSTARRLRLYNWHTLKVLDDEGLSRFLERLCNAWAAYQRRGPRVTKPRRQPGLFES